MLHRKLAQQLWESLPLAQQTSHSAALVDALLHEVQHPAEPVQRAAALALAHVVERNGSDAAEIVLQHLQDIFEQRLPVRLLTYIIYVNEFTPVSRRGRQTPRIYSCWFRIIFWQEKKSQKRVEILAFNSLIVNWWFTPN